MVDELIRRDVGLQTCRGTSSVVERQLPKLAPSSGFAEKQGIGPRPAQSKTSSDIQPPSAGGVAGGVGTWVDVPGRDPFARFAEKVSARESGCSDWRGGGRA